MCGFFVCGYFIIVFHCDLFYFCRRKINLIMRYKLLLFVSSFIFAFNLSAQTVSERSSSFVHIQSVSGVKAEKVRADQSVSRFAVSTNAVDWSWYITPNLDLQYAVARRWTIAGTAKYNNWTYWDEGVDKRNRQCRQEYALGFRYWPWYTYSGWWFNAGAQYQEYSRRQPENIFRKEEGDAVGLSLGAGYSVQVTPMLNVDFGMGFWGGHKYYKVYESTDKACPECGKRVDRIDGSEDPSQGWFILPNYVSVSLMLIL